MTKNKELEEELLRVYIELVDRQIGRDIDFDELVGLDLWNIYIEEDNMATVNAEAEGKGSSESESKTMNIIGVKASGKGLNTQDSKQKAAFRSKVRELFKKL